MSKLDVIRAWKDAEYRSSLTDKQRAMLPANPAGALDLSESDLESVAGGAYTNPWFGCGTQDWLGCGTQFRMGCPTGDYAPCPSQFLCPLTMGSDFCPIIE